MKPTTTAFPSPYLGLPEHGQPLTRHLQCDPCAVQATSPGSTWGNSRAPVHSPGTYSVPCRCSWTPTNWRLVQSWTCSAGLLPQACSLGSTTHRTWPGPSSPAQVRPRVAGIRDLGGAKTSVLSSVGNERLSWGPCTVFFILLVPAQVPSFPVS